MDCPKCGYALGPFEKECPRCQQRAAEAHANSPAAVWPPAIGGGAQGVVATPGPPAAPAPFVFEEDNSSGEDRGVPPEIEALRWNWGAFLCGWVWCFFHRLWGLGLGVIGIGGTTVFFLTYFSANDWGYGVVAGELMALVLLGVHCHLGLKGYQFAWERRRFPGSIAQFLAVQQAWTNAGAVWFVVWVMWLGRTMSRVRELEESRVHIAPAVPTATFPGLSPAPPGYAPAEQPPQRPPVTIYLRRPTGGQGLDNSGSYQRRLDPNYRGYEPPTQYVPVPGGGVQAEPTVPLPTPGAEGAPPTSGQAPTDASQSPSPFAPSTPSATPDASPPAPTTPPAEAGPITTRAMPHPPRIPLLPHRAGQGSNEKQRNPFPMTLIVDLPPEVESKVREVARAEGLEVSALLREAAEARLRLYNPARTLTDSQLLARINEGFSEKFWNRYRRLIGKRRAETLTRKEQQELIGMSDQLEAWHVERLQYLLKLAEVRHTSIDALTQELGLRPMLVE